MGGHGSTPRFGLLKTTALDYPGRLAAVVFTAGCNLRCPWCQNPGLVVPPWDPDLLVWDEVLAVLKARRPVLSGVVFSGGEPLLQPDLAARIAAVRTLGYAVKLDTNGTRPEILAGLTPATIDYVALDVKNLPARYALSAGTTVDPAAVRRSVDLLRAQWPGRAELRLTWVPGLNRPEDLAAYAAWLGPGLPLWVQGYVPGPTLDQGFVAPAPAAEDLAGVAAALRRAGLDARVRP